MQKSKFNKPIRDIWAFLLKTRRCEKAFEQKRPANGRCCETVGAGPDDKTPELVRPVEKKTTAPTCAD